MKRESPLSNASVTFLLWLFLMSFVFVFIENAFGEETLNNAGNLAGFALFLPPVYFSIRRYRLIRKQQDSGTGFPVILKKPDASSDKPDQESRK